MTTLKNICVTTWYNYILDQLKPKQYDLRLGQLLNKPIFDLPARRSEKEKGRTENKQKQKH